MSDHLQPCQPRLTYLSESQARRIHETSLQILDRTGAIIDLPGAVELLARAGCRVEGGKRVHIPPARVEWALKTAPRRIVLSDREGQRALSLEPGNVYFGPGSDCLFLLDHRDGRRRPATLSDVEEAARLADALPNIDFLMSAVLPSDVPPERANQLQMRAMLTESTKPILFVTNEFESSVEVVRAAEAVAGGEKALAASPICGCYINVTAPLRHNADSLRKVLHLAAKGIPTTYTPMVLRGVSGPVTSAGAIALANAGELVGLVLAQLKREGAPIIHSGGYGDVFDMRSMTGIYAGPESYGGRAAMAAYYGLPSFGLGGCSDSKLPDGQAVAEASLTMMLEALSGINLVHDVGYLESGKCFSFELLTIGDEVGGFIRRFRQGVSTDDEHLAFELIDELGPEGDYLGTEHTVGHFRRDWIPGLFDRNHFDGWAAQGSTTLQERARKRIEEILSGHRAPALSDAVHRKVTDILG
jgi:trimethylamine--corrinoid protein Co-methyltransferase